MNYTTAAVISELASKGYKLVSDSFNVTTMPENGGHYEVHFASASTPDKKGKTAKKPTQPAAKTANPANPQVATDLSSEKLLGAYASAASTASPAANSAQAQANAAAQNKLPQTGNKDSRSALAAGFIGLAGLLALLGLRKRKHN